MRNCASEKRTASARSRPSKWRYITNLAVCPSRRSPTDSVEEAIRMTHGKVHDVKALDHLPIEPGAYYVMDRGYVDYTRLHRFEQAQAFFVIRAKKNMDFTVCASRRVDKAT